jgi:hypothetical protein
VISSPLKKSLGAMLTLVCACELPGKHAHGKRGHGTQNTYLHFFNGLLGFFQGVLEKTPPSRENACFDEFP